MDKKMENELDTGIIMGYIVSRVYLAKRTVFSRPPKSGPGHYLVLDNVGVCQP